MKLIDKLFWRLGYVRKDSVISGTVEWKTNGPPFVDLMIPRGRHVYGHIHGPIMWMKHEDDYPGNSGEPI